MPRSARIKSAFGMYHIMVRGNNKQVIFGDDEDRLRFVYLLSWLPKQYSPDGEVLPSINCSLYAYCLMPNHVHLLYREQDEDLEHSMKRLLTSYAKYYNEKYGRVGHLFQDRFKSEPCDDMDYYLILMRYIHQNPLKANLVQDLNMYPWSSWHEYANPAGVKYKVCDTQATLKRISSADLQKQIRELLPDDIDCIDDSQEVRKHIGDNEVKQLLSERWNVSTPSDFQLLTSESQKECIRGLYGFGAKFKQIADFTGKSYRQVYKTIKNNAKR